MRVFIDNTEERIENTLRKLLQPNLSNEEKEKEIARLQDLHNLRKLYIKLQEHVQEKELIM